MMDCGHDKISMKRKLLEELLADLDEKESEKLKPKAAMISVEEKIEPVGEPEMVADMDDDEEMDDEQLKALLKSRLGA